MMKKRLLSLVLCVGLVLGLAGCGSSPAAEEDTLPRCLDGQHFLYILSFL